MAVGGEHEGQRRIVVGFDRSRHAVAALAWAAAQAQRTHSVLEVVAVFGPEYVLVAPLTIERALNRDLERATALAWSIAPDLTVVTRPARGAPDRALLRASEGADLLAVGSRGRGGFGGLLLGSVSRRCVHRATCPVLVARGLNHDWSEYVAESPAPEEPAGHEALRPPERAAPPVPHRIVVGVDGSPGSAVALAWAADQATLTDASLEVLMAWRHPEQVEHMGDAVDTLDSERKSLMDEMLEPVLHAHPTLDVHPSIVHADPAPFLVNASLGADLLVVGAQGRSELSGLLLGSVADYCVGHSHCPVLVARGAVAREVGARSTP